MVSLCLALHSQEEGLSFPVLACTSAGVITFLMSLGILQSYQWGQWRRLEQDLAALVEGSQENGVQRAEP